MRNFICDVTLLSGTRSIGENVSYSWDPILIFRYRKTNKGKQKLPLRTLNESTNPLHSCPRHGQAPHGQFEVPMKCDMQYRVHSGTCWYYYCGGVHFSFFVGSSE